MSDPRQKDPIADKQVLTPGMTNDHGWYRWKEVTKYRLPGHRLFRASSPNYVPRGQDPINGGDKSQHLTQEAVSWLTRNEINSVISFNQYSYKPDELDLLEKANITYRHYSTQDFHSPSVENLKAAVNFHAEFKDAVTLVHCGYGHGRTGTGVSAIQLYAQGGNQPTEREWIMENHVELMAEGEVENLRILMEYFKNDPNPCN